jgi:hypothetical protein
VCVSEEFPGIRATGTGCQQKGAYSDLGKSKEQDQNGRLPTSFQSNLCGMDPY